MSSKSNIKLWSFCVINNYFESRLRQASWVQAIEKESRSDLVQFKRPWRKFQISPTDSFFDESLSRPQASQISIFRFDFFFFDGKGKREDIASKNLRNSERSVSESDSESFNISTRQHSSPLTYESDKRRNACRRLRKSHQTNIDICLNKELQCLARHDEFIQAEWIPKKSRILAKNSQIFSRNFSSRRSLSSFFFSFSLLFRSKSHICL